MLQNSPKLNCDVPGVIGWNLSQTLIPGVDIMDDGSWDVLGSGVSGILDIRTAGDGEAAR